MTTRRSSRPRSDSTPPGLDQADPVRIYLYIFRNRASFEKLRATIDGCARSFVTDPQTFETVEQSPFVLAGQGPWAPGFEAAVRDALEVAAGTGTSGTKVRGTSFPSSMGRPSHGPVGH